MDANLNVLIFDNEEGAANFLSTVETWSDKGYLEIVDAVTAKRGVGSDIEVEQLERPGRKWAGRGAGIGLLAGILLGGPIGGAVAGAAIGGIGGSLSKHGIDRKTVDQITAGMGPHSSALFLMTTGGLQHRDELMAELKPHRALLVSSTLDEATAKEMRAALESEQ